MESGKFILRTDKALHQTLKKNAHGLNFSLNELCVKRLSLPSALENLEAGLISQICKLAEISGSTLSGIILFGSWARHETTDLSDIDLLVVVRQTKINRNLYRKWEAFEPTTTRIEPHFVALPTLSDRITGLWAEVALDGIIVCDLEFRVQRYLQHVRHQVASGKLVAKRSHGQNYWVHKEDEVA